MSELLGKSAKFSSGFEEKVSRGMLHYRSGLLQHLIDSVRVYVTSSAASDKKQALENIVKDFALWRVKDPHEFAARLGEAGEHFFNEITDACDRYDVDCTELYSKDAQEGEGHTLPPAPVSALNCHSVFPLPDSWVKNEGRATTREPGSYSEKTRGRKESLKAAKEWGETGLELGKNAYSVVQMATHVEGAVGDFVFEETAPVVAKGMEVVAHAASFAGVLSGVGLALTAVTSVVDLWSAIKTGDHLSALMTIEDNKEVPQFGFENCKPAGNHHQECDEDTHRLVRDHILSYIIHQKREKLGKKIASATVIGSLPVTLWTAGRKVYKWGTGELGVERYKAAHWLSFHICNCKCPLSLGIVYALTGSKEEVYWLLRNGDYEGIAEFLAEKMKSI